jgi:peptide/nickel transport system permease protein
MTQPTFAMTSVPGLLGRLSALPASVAASFGLIALLAAMALLAPVLASHDPSEQDLLARLVVPGLNGHWLGTDHLGRDLHSRLLFGLRTTLLIAMAGVTVGALLGISTGIVCGMVGGVVDDALMLLADTQATIPLTLLCLAAVAFVGSSPAILVIIVGIADYYKYARVVRAQTLSIKAQDFVAAAVTVGTSPARIALRHILPNALSPIIVLATIHLGTVIVLESALSFLGVGVQPPATSLGQLVGDARNHLLTAWWLAAIPGALIIALTVAVALIGDWLRDTLDPETTG